MGLKLVLFIDGYETFDSYSFPLDPDVEMSSPEEVYRREHAFSKSDNPCRETPDFTHEYKIMWDN